MNDARQAGGPGRSGGEKERRRHPRLTIPLNAEYIFEGGAGPRPGRIRDLSAGGTALLTTETAEPGGRLTSLRFLLPAEHGEPARLIDTPATVVRVVTEEPIPDRLAAAAGQPEAVTGWLLGLQFEGIGQRDRERIQHFVYRRLMKEKMPATQGLGSRRIPFARPIAVRFERFDNFVEEVSSNLSETGMFITTRSPARPGQVFELQFTLGEDFALIEGQAEVVWVRERAAGPDKPAGMGVRFVRLDDSSRAVIQRLVSAYRAAGEEPFDVEQQAGLAGPSGPEPPLAEPPVAEPVSPTPPTAGAGGGVKRGPVAPPPPEAGDLQTALDEALAVRRQMEAKLAAVIGERDQLGQEAASLRAALAEHEERAGASEAAAARARDQEQRREQERLQQQERLRHAEADLQGRLEAAEAGAAELREELEATVGARAALEERIAELERSAAAAEAERREEAEQRRAAAESERVEAARREQEHASLSAELDRSREAQTDLTSRLEEAEGRAAELQAELERAAEKQSALEMADERAAELRAELERAIEERSALEEKTRRLEASLAAAATPPETASLRRQLEALESELEDARVIARQTREEGRRREQELLDRLEAARSGPAAVEGPVVEHATADRRRRGLRGAGLAAGGAALGALALLAVLRLDSGPGESPAIDPPRGAPAVPESPTAEAPAAAPAAAPEKAPEPEPAAAPGGAAGEAPEAAEREAAPAAAEAAGAAAAEEAVRAWAAAWSEQRVEDYLASYSRQFIPPDGASRTEWEASRRVRLERPAWIRLELGSLAAELTDPTRARVSFDQSYETPTYSDQVRKTLDLVWEDAAWKISGERAD